MSDPISIIRDTLAQTRLSLFGSSEVPTITPEAYLSADLRIDHVEIGIIAMTIEDEFNVRFTDEMVYKWERVQDIVDSVEGINERRLTDANQGCEGLA